MKNERWIKPDVAGFRQAFQQLPFVNRLLNVLFGNQPQSVRAKSNDQWTVCMIDRIDVQAHSDHVFEQRYRRRYVRTPLLDGPGAESGNVYAILHLDCAVLMPAQCPVTAVALVKKQNANGSRRRSDMLRGRFLYPIDTCKA